MNNRLFLLLAWLFVSATCAAQQTAQEWNREVIAGWNLGNQFECSPVGQDSESPEIGLPDGSEHAETAWGNPVVTKKMIKAVHDAGFNAIRIPVRWQCHITSPAAMSIDKTWMNRIKEVIGWCLDYDMKVIVNVHHEKWLESFPFLANKTENCQRLALLWMNIAEELKHYDGRVAFAGTNEVHEPNIWGKPTAENLDVQNAYNQTFVDIVRATGGNNAKRHLIVQTYACNPEYGVNQGDFIIPTDMEGNGNQFMSVEIHYYNPWSYAGSNDYYYWGTPYKQYGAAPEDETSLCNLFDRAVKQWADKGLGIVAGEWGVTDHYKPSEADRIHENMTYYCSTYVYEARRRGFSTFVWDNGQFGNGPDKFGIFDRKRNMTVKAPWILKGIQEGVARSTALLSSHP